MQGLRSYLSAGHILIADGATGTVLQSMGLEPGAAPELWNVEKPDSVRALHRAYLEAGAQVVLTNTFGASRLKLDRTGGLGDRVSELNEAAGRLARAEAGEEAYVAGDIGPSGMLMVPYGPLDYDKAVVMFAEEARALVDGGVDLIWVETMSDLDEAAAAVEGALQANDVPIFCSLSFTQVGRTIMGVRPSEAYERLCEMGVTAVGANCGEGVEPVIVALGEMQSARQSAGGLVPALIAKPNAGLPHLENGNTVFDLGPDEMAAYTKQFLELGAQVIGACCGSTPSHIAAIAAQVAEYTATNE